MQKKDNRHWLLFEEIRYYNLSQKKKLTKPSYYNTTCQQNLNVNLFYFMGPCDRVEKISATIKELSQQRARLKRNLHSRSPLTGPIQ